MQPFLVSGVEIVTVVWLCQVWRSGHAVTCGELTYQLVSLEKGELLRMNLRQPETTFR